MHQLVTHSALVSVRYDWETGKTGSRFREVGAIRVDTKTTLIYPMEINLEKDREDGFQSMVIGMQHIAFNELTICLVALLFRKLSLFTLFYGGNLQQPIGLAPSFITSNLLHYYSCFLFFMAKKILRSAPKLS